MSSIFRIWMICLSLPLCATAQETFRQYLSGRDKDDAVSWRFMCTTGAQSSFWTNILVPSNWELQGFGHLNYFRDPTNAWTEKGLYEHDFTIPTDWSNRRIYLVFEGAMTDTEAKLNGQSVGPVHQGSFYRFKYEVTKLANFSGTNRLEVSVAKRSADMSVNRAERTGDYWVFGGIYRPVYLEAAPRQFIERVAIDAKADGTLILDAYLNGITDADKVEAQITGTDGRPVAEPFQVSIASEPKVRLQTQYRSPLQWTAEKPNLYSIDIRLKRGNQVLHKLRQRFGFRTMEVRDGDGLYVNGQRVMLKGVNRHSFWPDSGRCLSDKVHRLDIETIKDMNMNAVRMSHYPPDGAFLDLCDELGLYVLDELSGWQKFYDTGIGTKLVEEMITHDVNHPSILFWCNGNEGGFNTNLDNIYSQFDPQNRRVLHPWASFGGLCTAHYLAYDKAQIAATGQSVYYSQGQELVATNDTAKYIYMPTEFLHGLYDGGAGAGFADYWQLMRQSKFAGGAFFWVLADEGIKRPNTGIIDVNGNSAPDGIVGPYRQREGSFNTIKKIWSPIQVTRQADNTLLVENSYSFTDANACKFTWQLREFATPEWSGFDFHVRAQGTLEVPSIAPGQTRTVDLKLPDNWKSADAIALQVHDPHGRELWTWVWPTAKGTDLKLLAQTSNRRVRASESRNAIALEAGDVRISIDRKTGLLRSARRGMQGYSLENGPRLAQGNSKLVSIDHRRDGSDQVVSAFFEGDLKSVVWRLRSNGWLVCDFTYSAQGPQEFLGVIFDYPENLVKGKRWLGAGPYRVWKNRLDGTALNVWQNDYNNTITGWRDWVYPEFKGCFADVQWLQLQTSEGRITVVPENVPFVQVLTPEQPPENVVAYTKVNLPQCGLGFLHAIPPIGTKFKDAKFSGPQSQPNIGAGEYSGSVSFHFGKL